MARQLAAPSPSPHPSTATPTLPAQINAATRTLHIELNRSIVERLPHSLPPSAANPELFGRGLAAFAQIFYVFEDEWDALLRCNETESGVNRTHDARVRQWIATLRPKGLQRTPRLEEDMRALCIRTGAKVDRPLSAQKKMLDRMRASIKTNPSLLIAYGWVMYMAVFSGGRWIRQQLSTAEAEFWSGTPRHLQLEKDATKLYGMPGFSFLYFDGEHDGEDIKTLFKSRLAEAEILLPDNQKQNVIIAAQGLFRDCIALVEILDSALWWQQVRRRVSFILLCMFGVMSVLFLWWFDNFGYLQE